ncbi:MAG: tetratricopeptide repeat protein [Cellvibrio sp.]|uniref:YfgM family protein n=1 Tax=Cellvibrio sp. TaxID=1965322 RepID=UPI00271E3735|nr:tetratricopeptide repeat protein [Cellvibrio sp.]
MANHLDLEEQEQLDQLKHFWRQYGNLITWVLIVVLGSFAAWNGYQYWQRSQAAQAAAMFDEVERSVASNDVAKIERALSDMNAKFGSSAYAQQAGLLAAKTFFEKGNAEAAKKALASVVEKSLDEGYQAIAKLRLASILIEGKNFDEALKLLSAAFPKDFVPLVADRRGDIFALQSKPVEAKLEYVKAYKAFDERAGYRRLVEVKLNALGGDPATTEIGSNVVKETATETKK